MHREPSVPTAEVDLPAITTAASTALRTASQHHVQLSAMADIKANIVITAASLVSTFAVSQVENPDLRLSMGFLLLGAVTALTLAVLAVLPNGSTAPLSRRKANPLFFAAFSHLDEDEYVAETLVLLRDRERIYEAQLRDLHRHGRYLATKKYRFLRLAYLSLLAAILGAAVIQGVALLLR